MKALAPFLGLLGFLLAGCASAAPPAAPIAPDPVVPPGHWEMTVAEDEAAPPPPAPEARAADKPNVASAAKRSLFTLTKKSQ